MCLDISRSNAASGTTYSRILPRSSYRENGKVKHRTLGNLSSCSPEEIDAVRLALLHKDKLAALLHKDKLAALLRELPAAPRPPEATCLPRQPPAGEGSQPFRQGPGVGAVGQGGTSVETRQDNPRFRFWHGGSPRPGRWARKPGVGAFRCPGRRR